MPSIGDLLSEKSKKTLAEIKIGYVYRMRLTREDGITPKNGDNSRDKYFIVLGVDETNNIVGHVLINTNINDNLSTELKNLQYPISHNRYSFLEGKTRYVNCSDLKKLKRSRFVELYNGEYGSINSEDLDLIIGALKESPTISKKDLKRFGIQ